MCGVTLEDFDRDYFTSDAFSFNDDYKMTRPTQYVSNHLFIYENNFFVNNNKFSFYVGHFLNNLQEYEKWTIPAFDMDLSTTQLRFNLRKKLNNFTLNIGSQATSNSNKNHTVDYLIPDGKSNDIGLYSILDYEKNNFGFNVGGRLDYKEIACDIEDYKKLFSSISSSAGAYLKHKNHIFRLTYSSAFRSPHLSELFSNGVHHGTNRHELGNSNLDIEKGHQFDFKYQWSSNHFGIVALAFL